jgi:hypothetical protein
MGVSPMSRMGILPMFLGICTGGTPVRLMGKMPMLLFQRAARHSVSLLFEEFVFFFVFYLSLSCCFHLMRVIHNEAVIVVDD